MTPEEMAMLAEVLSPEDMDELVTIDQVYHPLHDLDADVVIDDAQLTETERNRTLTLLMNMVQQYGPDIVPIELILEFTDNPVRNRLLAHLQAMNEQPPPPAEPGGAPV